MHYLFLQTIVLLGQLDVTTSAESSATPTLITTGQFK